MLTAVPSFLYPAPLQQGTAGPEPREGTEKLTASFGSLLKEKLAEVNNLQQQADSLTQQYLAGEVEDVHQVMLLLEQANLSLQMTVQVRNRIIEAYQEIARMQI